MKVLLKKTNSDLAQKLANSHPSLNASNLMACGDFSTEEKLDILQEMAASYKHTVSHLTSIAKKNAKSAITNRYHLGSFDLSEIALKKHNIYPYDDAWVFYIVGFFNPLYTVESTSHAGFNWFQRATMTIISNDEKTPSHKKAFATLNFVPSHY